MNSNIKTKELIISYLNDILDRTIETSLQAIKNAKESRDIDIKSSMGDKYETGRAMVQMELEKYELQLSKTKALKKDLLGINTTKVSEIVVLGSLVKTSQRSYFISIGMGKVEIDKQDYYCISLASPIGKALFNKRAGEKALFQNEDLEILNIS